VEPPLPGCPPSPPADEDFALLVELALPPSPDPDESAVEPPPEELLSSPQATSNEATRTRCEARRGCISEK